MAHAKALHSESTVIQTGSWIVAAHGGAGYHSLTSEKVVKSTLRS